MQSRGVSKQSKPAAAPASRPLTPSRRHALLGIAPLSILDPLADELKLWQGEADIYRRKASEKAQQLFGRWLPKEAPVPKPRLEPELATLLLDVPVRAAGEVPGFRQDIYRASFKRLVAQEQPFFAEAAACGHCGDVAVDEPLADADWVDFLSYIQFKALLQQLPLRAWGGDATLWGYEMLQGPAAFATPPPRTAPTPDAEAAATFRRAVGCALLEHVRAAQAPESDAADALAPGPPILDELRVGSKAILDFFISRGYAERVALTQLGMSRDEYEAHVEWQRGEPAVMKYWLRGMAPARSTAALQAEEGVSQDFIYVTLQAFFDARDVDTYRFKRIPVLSAADLLTEQFAMRRRSEPPEWRGEAADFAFDVVDVL